MRECVATTSMTAKRQVGGSKLEKLKSKFSSCKILRGRMPKFWNQNFYARTKTLLENFPLYA